MKRLIDEVGLDNEDGQLADLFRAVSPCEVDPFRKRRILVGLERGRARSALRFWLKPTAVALLLISGTAAAALGKRYVLHDSGFLGSGGASSAPAPISTVSAVPKRAPLTQHTQQLESEATPPPAEAQAPAASPLRAVGKASSRARPGSGEDATPVVEAIQALRTEKDPARAEALLNGYLKNHPRGQLSADALALSI